VVLKAVAQNGMSLSCASKELKKNGNFVLKAIAQDGKSLK